jgi:hypothetical protein
MGKRRHFRPFLISPLDHNPATRFQAGQFSVTFPPFGPCLVKYLAGLDKSAAAKIPRIA